eukprot:5229795-Prorocentrum_lima.AAC.1
MNTWCQKTPAQLATQRELAIQRGPPYVRGRQERLDGSGSQMDQLGEAYRKSRVLRRGHVTQPL